MEGYLKDQVRPIWVSTNKSSLAFADIQLMLICVLMVATLFMFPVMLVGLFVF